MGVHVGGGGYHQDSLYTQWNLFKLFIKQFSYFVWKLAKRIESSEPNLTSFFKQDSPDK